MHISIWSDFACPYCYIGEVRLRRVLRDLRAESGVSIVMKSFELDPGACPEVVSSTEDRFAKKYGLSTAEAAWQIERISQAGRREGLAFNYASTRYSCMLDAHRLAKWGADQGRPEIAERLFAAYFADNLVLSDRQVLAGIAVQAGLGADDALAMLSSGAYTGEVRRDEEEAMRMGIHGVPYFYIESRLSMPGCLPYAEMRSAIAGLLAQEHGGRVHAGRVCGPDGCLFEGRAG